MSALNQGQTKAFFEVIDFLNDPTRKIHKISGGPGTGKSFFISKVIKDVLKHVDKEKCQCIDVAVTATTNKAAAVLKNSMTDYRGPIQTIYSFMNLRVQPNYHDGTQKVVPTKKWEVHFSTFIIVDEASMVNQVLYNYIDKGTSDNCKILYVGDKDQLSPVKEKVSPVYSNNHSESLLTEPMRNNNQPALMALCEQARQTVLTGVFTQIQPVPGVIDFVNGNQTKGILEREYYKENHNQRVLCYTNAQVLGYNDAIRSIRGYSQYYTEGEFLTNNSSAELVDKSRLYSDQVVQVIERGQEYMNNEIIPGVDIPVVPLVVNDADTSTEYLVSVFADPPDRKAVLDYWKSHKKWDRYFKIRDSYPDLRSIASSTTHKAQGSTYDSVIVDLADIGKSTNLEQTARLQYVALSRPKNRIYIRGQLPERYFK